MTDTKINKAIKYFKEMKTRYWCETCLCYDLDNTKIKHDFTLEHLRHDYLKKNDINIFSFQGSDDGGVWNYDKPGTWRLDDNGCWISSK